MLVIYRSKFWSVFLYYLFLNGPPSSYWALISSYDREVWSITLTDRLNLTCWMYLGQRSFSYKLSSGHSAEIRTFATDCCIWTTNIIGFSFTSTKSRSFSFSGKVTRWATNFRHNSSLEFRFIRWPCPQPVGSFWFLVPWARFPATVAYPSIHHCP